MTCQLRERLERLTRLASQASERITLWHPRQGSDTVQVSLTTDPVAASGNGETICEALTDLEQILGLEPLVGCCTDSRVLASAETDY